MKIALDYDGTITADVKLWAEFVKLAKAAGHEVHIVTMRYPYEQMDNIPDFDVTSIIYTSRKAKKPHCEALGIHFNIWIDDNPHWVGQDAGDAVPDDITLCVNVIQRSVFRNPDMIFSDIIRMILPLFTKELIDDAFKLMVGGDTDSTIPWDVIEKTDTTKGW